MANQLLDLMGTNQKVLKKIITAKTHEDAFKIAQENISDYKDEDFQKDIEQLEKIMAGDDDNLDNGQLDSVTGGVDRNSSFQLLSAFSERNGIDLLEVFKRWK